MLVFSEPEIDREHERKGHRAQLVVADPLTGHLKGATECDDEVVAEQDIQRERSQLGEPCKNIIIPKQQKKWPELALTIIRTGSRESSKPIWPPKRPPPEVVEPQVANEACRTEIPKEWTPRQQSLSQTNPNNQRIRMWLSQFLVWFYSKYHNTQRHNGKHTQPHQSSYPSVRSTRRCVWSSSKDINITIALNASAECLLRH